MSATLDRIDAIRGYLVSLRFDNGPSSCPHAIADWCRFNGTRTGFIDPGSPWQNAWCESFNAAASSVTRADGAVQQRRRLGRVAVCAQGTASELAELSRA